MFLFFFCKISQNRKNPKKKSCKSKLNDSIVDFSMTFFFLMNNNNVLDGLG